MPPSSSTLELDDQLCFALYAASSAIVRAYRPLLKEVGLTYPQYLVMMVLWEEDGLPVHEIADRLASLPHALSPVLERMVDTGLLGRERDRWDGRVQRMRLTASGRALETAVSDIQAEVVRRTRLDPGDLGALRTRLHALTTSLETR